MPFLAGCAVVEMTGVGRISRGVLVWEPLTPMMAFADRIISKSTARCFFIG